VPASTTSRLPVPIRSWLSAHRRSTSAAMLAVDAPLPRRSAAIDHSDSPRRMTRQPPVARAAWRAGAAAEAGAAAGGAAGATAGGGEAVGEIAAAHRRAADPQLALLPDKREIALAAAARTLDDPGRHGRDAGVQAHSCQLTPSLSVRAIAELGPQVPAA